MQDFQPLVSVVMGSSSDRPIMQKCIEALEMFEVKYEVKILSAHRTPDKTALFAKEAEERGVKVVIAGAGGAAHLAGAIAAHTTLPVIGVPLPTSYLQGIDALYSTVQMPPGVPVACMAVGEWGAFNAGIFAVQIVSFMDESLRRRLKDYKGRFLPGRIENEKDKNFNTRS